jgi:hypothetical protein
MDPLVALVHRPRESFFVLPKVWYWCNFLLLKPSLLLGIFYSKFSFFCTQSHSSVIHNTRCMIDFLLVLILFLVRFYLYNIREL